MSNKKAKSSEVPIKKKVAREAAEWGKSLLYAVVAATIIRLFVFETMLVPTGSMIPTINPKDRLFIEKITYTAREPKIGDIVVFWSPIHGSLCSTAFQRSCEVREKARGQRRRCASNQERRARAVSALCQRRDS